MDDSLKCNIVSCRKPVSRDAKAVVTNCSHIFCLACANAHTSLTHPDPYPVCPACDSQLTEPEDVVCTSLNPSPDYKSSVLSGLPPATVLEIATRALNFWAYQQSMEATFQHMILKQAHERAAAAEQDRDIIQTQANSEIKILSEKLTLSETELSNERRKVNEAAERRRNAQKQYEKLKANFEKVRIQSLVNSVPDPIRVNTPLTRPQASSVRGAPMTIPESIPRSFGTSQTSYKGTPLPPDRIRANETHHHPFRRVQSRPSSNEKTSSGNNRRHSGETHFYSNIGSSSNNNQPQLDQNLRRFEIPRSKVLLPSAGHLRRAPRNVLHQRS